MKAIHGRPILNLQRLNLQRLKLQRFGLAIGATLLLCGANANAGLVLDWQASSGSTPDAIANPWLLVDTASPEDPVLAGGLLTLSTSARSENMYYIQTDPLLDTSSAFYVEASVRLVSGTSNVAHRGPIGIGLASAPNVGSILWIDHDSVFFSTGNSTVGTKITNIDTNDALHTYRIEYDGVSGLKLFYDGSEILTGSTFNNATFNGPQQRIFWGEISARSNSVSEWAYVKHNALTAVPEPSNAIIMFAALGLFGLVRFRK